METMNENYLNGIAEANGYTSTGKSYWKEVDHYFIELVTNGGKVYAEIMTGMGNESMPVIIGEETAIISEKEKVSDCIIYNSSIILSFEIDSFSAEEVEELTSYIIKVLADNRIPGIVNCQLCNTSLYGSDHSRIKVNNRHMKVHKACHEKLENDIEKSVKVRDGNYVTGIVGAIVFGAIGTIPWIIISSAGWIVSILGLVIAYSANFGYNLFKGKKGKVKSVTLVIVIVSMVISASFVTQLYELFNYLGEQGIEDVSLIDGIKFIFAVLKEDSEFAASFIKNAILGVGFGLAGSWKVIMASENDVPRKKLNVEVVSTNWR